MEIIRNRKKQIALGIVMTLVLLTFFSYFSLDVKAASTTIVVNPGHLDGVDTGAVNKSNGIREVDLNNALAIKVVSTLRQNGYNAMLSHPVPGNPGLPTLLSAPPAYSAYSTTICNKANQIGADLLISIHHNSGAATASGYEFYWSSYHPSVDTNGIYQKPGLWSDGSLADLDATPPTIALKSKELANLLNDNFSENLTYVPSRDKIIERDDAITRKTSMPSVLIEAGYVSNNAEVVKMADDNNQQQMANQILASINELFGANTDLMTATSFTASVNGDKITATVNGVSAPNGLQVIYIPVWSDDGGQDDLKWYPATKQGDGSYSATIDVKDHGYESGNYQLHCYGVDSYGKYTLLGHTTVNVTSSVQEKMTASSVTGTVSGNKITATVKGISAPNGLTGITIPVWSETGGQDDLKWYSATKQSDGSYRVTIDIKDHNYSGGVYNIHVYGTDDSGKQTFLGNTSVSVATTPMSATSVKASVAENMITVVVSGITAPNGIKKIEIPTWSDINGQDDLIWYTATEQSDGSYKVVIDAKNHHGDSGTYLIDAYGVESDGRFVPLGSTSASVRYVETPIMGETTVTAAELVAYYKASGSVYPQIYNDLGVNLEKFVDLYIQECKVEGVRAEVAFAQAMLETGNLQFGGDVKVTQFNFAGLGATGGVPGFDFSVVYGNNSTGLQTGIRGHVQHLKCYACDEDLKQTNVDPRWNDKIRLRALSVEELAGTWAADTTYATKIKAIMKKF